MIIIGALLISAVVVASARERIYESFKEKPRGPEWFFEHSEVIAYVEVWEVDRKIKEIIDLQPPPGEYFSYPKQRASVKFLKVLKGPKELENTTETVIKGKSHFCLKEGEQRVLYLRKGIWRYHTVSNFGGWRGLGDVLARMNSWKKDKGSGFVVELVGSKGDLKNIEVSVLAGRLKAPVTLGSEIYKDNLVKKEKIGELNLVEISLQPGTYTVLIELGGSLYSSLNTLFNGCYYDVTLKEYHWRVLYFDIGELIE